MSIKPIVIREISLKRFNALAGQSRNPLVQEISDEIGWYANDDESILGVLLRDTVDDDFVSILMARDEGKRYSCFDLQTSIATLDAARDWLNRAMKWHTGQGLKTYPQGRKPSDIDLFAPVVPRENLHPYFAHLADSPHFFSAKSMISNLMPYFVDIDGTFVRQFQTAGFDARLWELYLNSYLFEEGLFLDRKHNAPDFMVKKFGVTVAIEAVIVGRRADKPPSIFDEVPDPPTTSELQSMNESDVPIRFGSPLFTKLNKRYWELPHVNGHPLVFAIADFYDNQSMLWSFTGFMNYLYGVHHDFHYDDQNRLVISPQEIDFHKRGEKVIPSGYFFQPDAEHVSAVLFSACGTISKFNRIGRQAGFSHPSVRLIRQGVRYNHNPDASLPTVFSYEVNEESNETWGEGMSMFHNPNARFPVPEELFPSIAHHRFEDGQIASTIPEFHPFTSCTLNIRVVP